MKQDIFFFLHSSFWMNQCSIPPALSNKTDEFLKQCDSHFQFSLPSHTRRSRELTASRTNQKTACNLKVDLGFGCSRFLAFRTEHLLRTETASVAKYGAPIHLARGIPIILHKSHAFQKESMYSHTSCTHNPTPTEASCPCG